MDIHIARDGQQLGVFTFEQVELNLMTGELQPTDQAWTEGLTAWLPLQKLVEVLEPEGEPAAEPVRRSSALSHRPGNSGLASTSLVLGIVLGVVWVLMIVAAAGAAMNRRNPSNDPMLAMLGCGFLLAGCGNLVGGIMGIVAASQPITNKGSAIAGIVLNFGALAALGALMAIGMSNVK